MAGASQPSDLDGRATLVREARDRGRPHGVPESAAAFLPLWLMKELQRAGVSDEIIKGLDEETARSLVAEIRSDEIE
jgi:hypothetical protein